jgi:hypothetical protein
VRSGGGGAALPAARRCAVLPILDLHLVWCLLVWKKEEKNKKIHELQLRFSYRFIRLFGMPAERTSFGALADITVTTSYRATTLHFSLFQDYVREREGENCSVGTLKTYLRRVCKEI